MSGFFAVDIVHHQRTDAGVITSYQLGQGPSLLLLHDVAGSARYWGETLTQHVLDQYRVTVVDQRGHGTASHFGDYTMAAFVADACAVMTELSLNHTIIIGQGLGALQACAVAQASPNQVRALILLDPPWWETSPSADAIATQQAQWRHQLMGWQQMSDEDRLQSIVRTAPDWTPVAVHAWSDSRAQCDTHALAWLEAYATSFEMVVRAIQYPTLVIYGDTTRGTHMTDAVAQKAQSLSALVTCAYISETGHDAHHDRPKAYMKAVRAFLRARV